MSRFDLHEPETFTRSKSPSTADIEKAQVFVRPGELRHAEWSEFDLENAIWTRPAVKTKMRREHRVPLSRQALTIIAGIATDARLSPLVFPSLRSAKRPMSENTINAALRSLGYAQDEMTAHGFRAMASTLPDEMGKWNPMLLSGSWPMQMATKPDWRTRGESTRTSGFG